MPNITGEIETQSRIIEQKLESSQRLEVTKIEEKGVIEEKTNVIILGTVGSTTIDYQYTASVGIDLKKVIMNLDSDRIVFILPDNEILNDGIEALKIVRHDTFSKAIDRKIETLLAEQREKCREQYLNEENHTQKVREDTVKAFRETVLQWMEETGAHHFEIEILTHGEPAAV